MSDGVELLHGDCLELLRTLPDNSVDAVVTDPPYGLKFMGKRWDCSVPSVAVWAECLRVLKPGGHLLAFAGTRTQHRMAVNIEDAGFEIRDMIAWVYGSGFPKSLDVSKAIDKAAGAEREIVGRRTGRAATLKQDIRGGNLMGGKNSGIDCSAITAPATEAARQWQGWGTALKPALEPITVARKPLIGTVAENVLEHEAGALNIDGCRVGGEPSPSIAMRASGRVPSSCKPGEYGDTIQNRITPERWQEQRPGEQLGRWPANLIHDGSEEVADLLGSAARFFYCPKASKADRNEGCEELDGRLAGCLNMRNDAHAQANGQVFAPKNNFHPTVKPTALMRYLCRLVTPPGGTVLDPFMGSGSTGKAAVLEGFGFVGMEREAEYIEIARVRIGRTPRCIQTSLFEKP